MRCQTVLREDDLWHVEAAPFGIWRTHSRFNAMGLGVGEWVCLDCALAVHNDVARLPGFEVALLRRRTTRPSDVFRINSDWLKHTRDARGPEGEG